MNRLERDVAQKKLLDAQKTEYLAAVKVLAMPNCLILSNPGETRERLINGLLDSILLRYADGNIVMLETFSFDFWDYHFHPCVSTYAMEKDNSLEVFQSLHQVIQDRMSKAKKASKGIYRGIPIFVFTSSFSLYNKAEHKDAFDHLSFLINHGRKTKVRVICFDKPGLTEKVSNSCFSSIALLRDATSFKGYHNIIPATYENTFSDGALYLDGNARGVFSLYRTSSS